MFTLDADEQRPLASPPVSVPAATLREITKLSSGEWVALLTGFSSLDLIHPYSLLLRSRRPLSISYQVSVYSLTDNSYASGWIRHREGKPLEWIFHQYGVRTLLQNNNLKNKFSNSNTDIGEVTVKGPNPMPEDDCVDYCVRYTQMYSPLACCIQIPSPTGSTSNAATHIVPHFSINYK